MKLKYLLTDSTDLDIKEAGARFLLELSPEFTRFFTYHKSDAICADSIEQLKSKLDLFRPETADLRVCTWDGKSHRVIPIDNSLVRFGAAEQEYTRKMRALFEKRGILAMMGPWSDWDEV